MITLFCFKENIPRILEPEDKSPKKETTADSIKKIPGEN